MTTFLKGATTVALLALLATTASAQDSPFSVDVEGQGSFSNSTTPLWLNANKYGLSSLKAQNGYVRATGTYEKLVAKNLTVKAGADLVLPIGYVSGADTHTHTEHFILQQAYAELDYKLGELIIGAKQMPMELKNNELSSGSQTLGINARPVPQLRIGLNDYWNIPFTAKWVSFKGHLAFGIMTDGNWQEDFARGTGARYCKGTWYHQKAGYLRIGNEEKFPLTFTFGLEMASEFGAKAYFPDGSVKEYSKSFSNFWSAFTGSESGNVDASLANGADTNLLGSWVARLNWKADTWEAGIYADHFFEDHSAMFLLDYDGYGNGEQWNNKLTNRYFRYGLKDIMLGADIKLKNFKYVNQAVVEFMNTRYQSGPIYHDHSPSVSTHICGRDDYYNHGQFSGWQHWGQVIGNPLYLSPLYNSNGYIGVQCNRFYAWHFGIAGDPIEGLHYRIRASWQEGLGTYNSPYYYPRRNFSMGFEASYRLPDTSVFKGFTVTGAYGFDNGELRGNNSGVQIGIKYHIL